MIEKNNKVFFQFKAFIKENYLSLSPYEIRLLNIILDNFDEVASKKSYQGSRSKILAELIAQKGKDVSDRISAEDQVVTENIIHKIKSIDVQGCKGFDHQQTIVLKEFLNLVYGPNGSGKSSLCEALEYQLLGYIEEGKSKKINKEKYIKNARKEANPLNITIRNFEDEEILTTHETNNYEFCFIEKNRIEDFARISSSTSSEQTERLGRLFGFGELLAFSRNFNDIETFKESWPGKTGQGVKWKTSLN